jgi:glutamyl-tRNA synthetase
VNGGLDRIATEPGRVVGRLAPSPTGALHLGNARTFLLAWLSARQQSGCLRLRIEDLDSPRVKPEAVQQAIEDLKWLGLDWDTSCDESEDVASGTRGPAIWTQTARLARYEQILRQMIEHGRIYPCICTRSDVAAAASAPHEGSVEPLEGHVYPGTCLGRQLEKSLAGRPHAWRWHYDDSQVEFYDTVHGWQSADPRRQLGDFVIAKSDGHRIVPAYQLAVVVDDYDQGVTEVVRGDDLLISTFRQRPILDYLGWQPPRYVHVPLVVGPDGRRLAKRHGDTRLSFFREVRIAPQAVVGYLAWTLDLIDRPESLHPRDLVGRLRWQSLPRTASVFDMHTAMPILRRLSATVS